MQPQPLLRQFLGFETDEQYSQHLFRLTQSGNALVCASELDSWTTCVEIEQHDHLLHWNTTRSVNAFHNRRLIAAG